MGEADAPPISRVEAEHEALKAVATIEKALIPAAVSAAGVAGAIAAHDAVLSAATPIAAAIALAKAGQFTDAAKKAKEAAERIYEAARELWKAAKVALERIYEAVVEAIARALDYVKAHWFIFAAAAAGLITYITAQQLDFSLWQDHVAKFAFAIAGVPAFKKAELPLREKAPQVWEAAERFWELGGKDNLRDLVNAVEHKGGWLKAEAVKAVRAVKRRVGFTWRDVAVAYALAEAAYREVAPYLPDVERAVKDVAERLAKGEAADVTAYLNQFRDFLQKVSEVEEKLYARLYEIRQYAGEFGLSEAEFKIEVAEKLATAKIKEFGKLSGATLADKVLAFVKGFTLNSAYSRAVLELAERGKGLRTLAYTPSSAYEKYYRGRSQIVEDVGEKPLRKILAKLLAGSVVFEIKKLEIRPGEDITKYITNQSDGDAAKAAEALTKSKNGAFIIVAEVKTSRGIKKLDAKVKWRKEGSDMVIYGPLADMLTKWFKDESQLPEEERAVVRQILRKLEEIGEVAKADGVRLIVRDGAAEREVVAPIETMGMLLTDWSVNKGEKRIESSTTSLFQAFLDTSLGMKVSVSNIANVTEVGIKVHYTGRSTELYKLYKSITGHVRSWLGGDLPEELREVAAKLAKREQSPALSAEDQKRVEEVAKIIRRLDNVETAVKKLIRQLWKEGKIAVHPDIGMTSKKVIEKVMQGVSEILNVNIILKMDPERHTRYGRIIYPLLYMLLENLSEVQFAKAFTVTVIGDGSVYHDHVRVTLGEFDTEEGVIRSSYSRFHKLALWLAVLEKYRPLFEKYDVNVIPRIYVRENAIDLIFDVEAAGVMFALGGGLFWQIHDAYLDAVGRNVWDHVFIKTEKMIQIVKEAFKDVEVHWTIDEGGERPVLRLAFVREVNGQPVEVTNMNVYLKDTNSVALQAEFTGSREKAEILTSLLRLWGLETKARQKDKYWHVELTTRQLAAVESNELKVAVNEFVEKLKEKGLLTERQAEKKIQKITTGPNVVRLAGVEFSINPMWKGKGKGLKSVIIAYRPGNRASFDQAVKALEESGLVRGFHFTANWQEYNYAVLIRIPEGLWAIALKAREDNQRAEAFIKQLRSVADRLGVRDYIEERLRPALLAGTKSVAGKTVAYQGVTVTIEDLIVRWEPLPGAEPEGPCDGPKPWCRPRVTVVYEIGNEEKTLDVAWGVGSGAIYAHVDVKNRHERAAALIGVAVWDDDEKEKERIWKQATEKSGVTRLTADNLLAMAQYKKELLEWYMAVRKALYEKQKGQGVTETQTL